MFIFCDFCECFLLYAPLSLSSVCWARAVENKYIKIYKYYTDQHEYAFRHDAKYIAWKTERSGAEGGFVLLCEMV